VTTTVSERKRLDEIRSSERMARRLKNSSKMSASPMRLARSYARWSCSSFRKLSSGSPSVIGTCWYAATVSTIGAPPTLAVLSNELEVSRERVRQIQREAEHLLRSRMLTTGRAGGLL
jgi:hypothetical protein